MPRNVLPFETANERSHAATTGRVSSSTRVNGRSTHIAPCHSYETSIRITRAIETEIIPRLLVSYRKPATAESPMDASCPSLESNPVLVAELARIVVDGTAEEAIRFVNIQREAGARLEDLYLQLLTPAARFLGHQWDEDERSFMEVTIGLGQLQQLVNHFTSDFISGGGQEGIGRRACIACVPGEQHTFGASLVAGFLERDGWEVGMLSGDSRDIAAMVRRDWFDLVGLSASCDVGFKTLMAMVEAVRAHSCNRQVIVMVGGRYFNDHPERFRTSGADLVATDGAEAVRRVHTLLQFEAVQTQSLATG